MASSADILKKIHKDHGNNIATKGGADYEEIARLPTGVYPVDLAMGGGFPMGKVSEVYGPESSNKTNLVLSAIREGQLKYPNQNAVFADAEHALDKGWARKLGVDIDRLIVLQPESAEQCVDFVESFTYAEDVFAVVLDSVAALTTTNEIESEASKMIVGGASLLTGKMIRKVLHAQSTLTNAGKQAPAFIAINQIRHKIGVMFGNPETTPGGNALKFAASMRVRVYGKNIVDKKVNPAMPLYKEVNVVLQKWKCPILAVASVYQMQMLEANGQKPGFVNDWNTLSSYMKELDYLSKADGGGWVMNGQQFSTLAECKEALYGDPESLQMMKSATIEELITAGGISAQVEEDETAEEE